jgi:hypothetical protein
LGASDDFTEDPTMNQLTVLASQNAMNRSAASGKPLAQL